MRNEVSKFESCRLVVGSKKNPHKSIFFAAIDEYIIEVFNKKKSEELILAPTSTETMVFALIVYVVYLVKFRLRHTDTHIHTNVFAL